MSKRKLTPEEIEEILAFIKPQKSIPLETALSIVKINKDSFRKQLIDQEVYPEIIPELKRTMEKMYYSTQVQPGEAVGIIVAQSIGENQTQTNLNAFHKAGSGENSFQIKSNFNELLNATKEPKSQNCFVYFSENKSTIEELRKTIGSSIVELTLSQVILSSKIIIEKEDEWWYDAFLFIHKQEKITYRDCISVKLDMEKLYMYKISMKHITDLIHEYKDVRCIFSPDDVGQLDIFIDTNSIELPEDRLMFIKKSEAPKIYMEEVVLPILEKMTISGVSGIKEMYFNKDPQGGWMVETNGGDFRTVLSHPLVDARRTITNHIWDIYRTLGIEATREFMIRQFSQLMPNINKSHIMLLVDKMTFRGAISSITRYTMRGEDGGPISKASFEETLDNFIKAALCGQHEPTRGISASIICGKMSQVGTGLCELKMNMKALPTVKKEGIQIKKEKKKVVEEEVIVKRKIRKKKLVLATSPSTS